MTENNLTAAHIQTIRNQLQRAKQVLDVYEIQRIKDVLRMIDFEGFAIQNLYIQRDCEIKNPQAG